MRGIRQLRIATSFRRDKSGTTAIIFALASFFVFGTVGLSVDGARIYAAQHRLQSILDAATLAAARRAALNGSGEEIEGVFSSYLSRANSTGDIAIRSAVPDTSKARTVSAEVVGDLPTVIMPLFGYPKVELRAYATVKFGFTRLEVALVLDNTGSMNGAKLDALKSSARRLVDTLLDRSTEPDAIRIALVPFSHYVNVGTDRRGEDWLQVSADYTETGETCGEVRPVISSTNCRTVEYTYTNDGATMTGSYQQCDNVYGDPVYQCTPYTKTYTWNGCVGSRNHPLNTKDTDYSTRVPGLLNTSCASRVQPLTEDRSTLHNAIDAMTASGETYIPAGMAWGMRVLSPVAPFDESAGDKTTADGDAINKILILMTDGANTKSPTYPKHDGTDATLANTLTTQTCDAAKSANLNLFTITFDVTDTSVKDLLRACASSGGNFFDASNTSQLDAAMQSIAQQLGALRLTN